MEKETELSLQNSKSVNVELFKRYLIEKSKLNEEVKEFYQREVWNDRC